jgi:8-oxo-dGTP pyrophosphatase MutT (NUDIX family)
MKPDQQTFYESLPKKRVSAGALFLNEQGQLLLVNPTYKPQWEIPGGVVEQDESPRQACIREVQEELGLVRPLERLLCVSYVPASPTRPDGLMFIFWGGTLFLGDIVQIQLPSLELSEYRFVDPVEAPQLLTSRLSLLVQSSLEILPTAQTLYLE